MMHGYAVGLGILFEARISQILGLFEEKNFLLIASIFSKMGIQLNHLKKYPIKKIIQATKIDKKSIAKKTHYVLLNDIGKVYTKKTQVTHHVDDSLVQQAYFELIDRP